ncbi:MAG TPA: TlpA disulfide reductase family protein [Burkholderiaceae bacterium]|nr:TlpA disulfide reductase family protein [Burkholderiaceae bacterium]
MTPARRTILLSLAAAGTLALAGCAKQGDAVPAVPIGTITGQQIQTADFKGKVTLVNFWATDCVTCVKEMPMLVDTYNKFKPRGYETVAVAMKHDRPDFVLHFAETRKLPFKVALDPKGEVALAWNNTRVTPTSYLVNKRGEIVKRYVGEPEVAEFHATIEKLLAES